MSITPLRDILVRFRTWLFARDPERKLPWMTLLEISFVLLWAVWVGREYLDFSSLEWPNGHEFGMAIQPHYIWTLLRQCGDCVLWNGLYNGGSPSFVEMHAAVLHPLVIVSTIIWGGLNGTKVVLIGSLAMAGLGQWWLGRVMGLSLVSRLWGAMLVITGGHLAGRMEIGVVGVVISTAACSLALAPALKLAFTGHRRDAVALGFILALAIVSGQGYLQLGFAFAILPALTIFWLDDRLRLRAVWKEFVWAGVLALLIAGPLLIPLGHFWPEFGKDIDSEFNSAQPVQYIPLNFVINDVDFYLNSNLDKQPHPYLYFNYIGWTPILLGIVPLVRARKSQRKQLLFLLLSLFLIIFTSSALPFKWLAQLLPDFANSIRNPSLIQGLAVPIIVALAGWGIDLILKHGWPLVKLAVSGKQSHKRLLIILTWVFMLLILFRSLETTYEFSFSWLHVDHNDDIVRQQVLDDVRTSGTQWIALPFGEHFWGPLAAERQLKLTDHVRPSHWKFRTLPLPFLKATRWEVDDDQAEFVNQHADISVVRFPANQYASIQIADETVPCLAQTKGGHIAVTCQSEQSGQLIVYENMWTGWTASRDGDPIPLLGEQWLTVEAPPGLHHYQFRYKPWDVSLGLGLMVIGLLLAIWMGRGYRLPGDQEPIPEPTEQLMDEMVGEYESLVVPEED